jgi:hypothetical protein
MGRLPASCTVIWLLPFLVSLHDVWDPAPCRRGRTPEHVVEDFARDVRGCEWGEPPLKRVDPLGGGHAFALPSCIAPFHLLSPRMGSARVAFISLPLEERDLAGVDTL